MELHLAAAPDYRFTVQEAGGIRVTVSHVEILELMAGNASVIARSPEGRSYTLFSGAVSECIKEADELSKHHALRVEAPSLAPERVVLTSRRQFFSGRWVSYTREQVQYPKLDLAVTNLALSRAKVTKDGKVIFTSGTLRRHCLMPTDDTPQQMVAWQALTHRIKHDCVAGFICTKEGNWCPRCLSRHVLLEGSKAQCLHCLHESHHHAQHHPDHNEQSRPVD